MAALVKDGAKGVAVKEKKPRKERAKRIRFVISDEAKGLLNDEGKLTRAPAEGELDPKKHLAPKKKDFSQDFIHMLYRAQVMEQKAVEMSQDAKRLREQAQILSTQPDPKKRASIKRMNKLRDQLAALEAELAGEGIKA